MTALISGVLALLGGIVGIVLWFLNNTPERKKEKRLKEKRLLEEIYAKAVAEGDTVTIAAVQRRMRELEAEEAADAGRQ